MIRGRGILVAVMTALVLVACDPLGGTVSVEVASISPLTVPYPTVVVGDVMRDTVGVPAPIKLTAFDAEGRILTTEPIQISIKDAITNEAGSTIHIDAQGFVHGISRDTLGSRVFAGAGAIEAPMQRILVSVPPARVQKSAVATAINFDVAAPDTSAQANWSPPLDVTFTDENLTGAQGFIVKYEVTKAPASKTSVSTAYIGDDAAKTTSRDTTNTAGLSSRRVILRQANLLDATKTDTIIVRATLLYGDPTTSLTTVDYIIPVKKKP